MKKKISIFTVLKILFSIGVVAVVLVPFIHMISVSFSDQIAVMRNEVFLIPRGFSLITYQFVLFHDHRILTAYRNTLVYVGLGTVVSLAVTAMGAYAASRRNMMFRKLYVNMIILFMFFNGGMIPTFLVVMKTGILNTVWAMVLPRAVSMYLLIVMMTFFSTIPKELEDSAKIDGLGDIGVFWHIALPISKAALAVIGLFYAVGIWNDFMSPLMYMSKEDQYPLTVLLRNMIIADTGMNERVGSTTMDKYMSEVALKYTTLIVSIVPIMCVYPFLQKYFVKGVLLGSLKG